MFLVFLIFPFNLPRGSSMSSLHSVSHVLTISFPDMTYDLSVRVDDRSYVRSIWPLLSTTVVHLEGPVDAVQEQNVILIKCQMFNPIFAYSNIFILTKRLSNKEETTVLKLIVLSIWYTYRVLHLRCLSIFMHPLNFCPHTFIILYRNHIYRYLNLSFTKVYCREIPCYLGIVTPLTVICLVSTFSNVGRWGRVAPKFFRSTSTLPGLGLSSQAGRTYSNNPCNQQQRDELMT